MSYQPGQNPDDVPLRFSAEPKYHNLCYNEFLAKFDKYNLEKCNTV